MNSSRDKNVKKIGINEFSKKCSLNGRTEVLKKALCVRYEGCFYERGENKQSSGIVYY